ncbi:hypothetical protein [Moorena sp. SIO4A1]|nr:hypothetical protein [Moorena sp. SIO4A1]
MPSLPVTLPLFIRKRRRVAETLTKSAPYAVEIIMAGKPLRQR